MISAISRPYIDASVPVLKVHGLAITRHFYASLFKAHPELQNLFNMGNQANGTQQQSLAAAVFAYAANIDNAAALAPVIERIVHKHASLGITSSHYPIVGRHLLGAIQTVLGDAATPPLMAAWDEAYWLLAGELIAAEARLYQQAGVKAGECMTVQVKVVQQESDDVVSYTLQTPQGTSPGAFKPGQYISVVVQLGKLRQLRQYSLSDSPDKATWRISVKREAVTNDTPAGQVSNCLHANIKAGDHLQISPAFGDFTPPLDLATPIVLISAGIGITPMVSILNTLTQRHPTRPVVFIHAARNGQHHALQGDLDAARAAHHRLRVVVCYESPLPTDTLGQTYHHAGRLDLAQALQDADMAGDFYLCGPIGFMQTQWQSLLAAKVHASRIHREVFGPELLNLLPS